MPSDPIGTLHRYFVYADRMRGHFDSLLKRKLQAGREEPEDAVSELLERLYMELWYGLLFVVVEGWQALELHDPAIDALLGSSHLNLLRRVRNGVFHFQPTYFDERYLGFVTTDGTAEWVRELHDALGRFFLEHIAQLKAARGDA